MFFYFLLFKKYLPPEAGAKIIIGGDGCYELSTTLALSLDIDKKYDNYVYDRSNIPVLYDASTGKDTYKTY